MFKQAELTRALPSLSDPYCESDVMVGMYSMIASNDILSNPANFTPPMRASRVNAARCKAGVAIALRHEKCFFNN